MRRRPNDAVISAILAGFGMLGPFSTDTVFPAFVDMADALGATPLELQQLVSVYMIAFAVLSLFHGPLSDALGRRPVIAGGLALYLVASVGCALAPNLAVLLAFRALQGAAAGASTIVGRALVRDFYSGERAQRVMATISMIFGIAPAVAPIIGGLLLGWTDWRGIFWFLAGWAALMMAATFVLPEPLPRDRRVAFSAGDVLRGLGVVWRHPGGRRLALIGALHFAGTFVYIAGAPLFVVRLLGGGERDFWWLFIPLVSGLVVGSWASGRLAHWSGRRLARLGYTVGVAGWGLNLAFALIPGLQGMPWSVAALPIANFGMALVFPILTLAMLDLFPANRGAAASVQGFVSLLLGALNAGLIAPLLAGSQVTMALGSLAFFCSAWALWTWHLRASKGTAPQLPHRG